ncbi:hypothetical protein [Deinococcus altitudinis]|uniref:hypothetical protein n=1 Tax=Deinococcus altitudinis TaxID=468914 RepID=UPI0038926EF7
MNITVSGWLVTRKKIRSSLSLGALGMLFSVSDRISGPKLSEQDRIDTVYPYRLEVPCGESFSGRYRLSAVEDPAPAWAEWAESLANRVWWTENARGLPKLVTDLTEYQRLMWEELTAQSDPTLHFEEAD